MTRIESIRNALFLSFAIGTGFGCAVESDDSSEYDHQRAGVANRARGQCLPEDCGGQSSLGTCWCDDACEDYGDCCANKDLVCEEVSCGPDDCGPPLGLPNYLCEDGVTVAGPGECVSTDGGCGWEIVECPGTFCGGIAGIPCPDGETCIDDPSDDCDPKHGGADCGGVCVEADTEGEVCGGWFGVQCQADEYCAFEIGDTCGFADAPGVCTDRPEICPFIFAPVCGCDGQTYGNACQAAAAGTSVIHEGACEPPTQFCGGIAGFPCPDGQECIDDPNDDCNPNEGGSDCGGICVPA